MKFRKDINGLRAFAVIAVVLFHFNAAWMPGGFAGVDVFFVISGFLMTGIIFRGMEQNNFSTLDFYVARANRIIPALALLCLVLLVFGWFYMSPLEYKALGKHAASSVGFLSNFTYWTEAGYFDAASHEKWLLHTWSLSVEWQFYIIYPLALLALRKFLSIHTLKLLLVIGTILSFIFSVTVTYKSPNAAYYLFPTRAWEMMIGGVAYLYPFTLKENKKRLLEWTGLILVVTSYFLISAESPWPGYLALFPVLGAFLIIQAQRNDSVITGNIVFQKLGAWSYSIYLWHWPFVVAIYTFSLPNYYSYIGMVLSVALGFLSYKYIEKIKFQRTFPTLLSYLKTKPVYISGFIWVLGSTLFTSYAVVTPLRLEKDEMLIVEQQQQDIENLKCTPAQNKSSLGCVFGQGPLKAIVIGDSHAAAQITTIGEKASLAGGSVLGLILSGCPTIKDVYRVYGGGQAPDYSCGKLVADAINVVSEEYSNLPVIVINRSAFYVHGFNENDREFSSTPNRFVDKVFPQRGKAYADNMTGHMIDTICDFAKTNPVYLVRPIPEMKKNVPLKMLKSSMINDQIKSIKITVQEYDQRQKTIVKMQDKAEQQCGAKILDPTPYLCDSEYCYGDIEDIPFYLDDDHLSSYGAQLISPIYDEILK